MKSISNSAQSISYRHDINGLRALAVTAVILFHCGFYSLSGGFIGVDIFFVISGFLITSLLTRDLTNQKFSLITFYAKRIRRLYPALVFTLLITLLGGYFIFMPDELKELGQSTVSVVLYISNIFFWLKSDYFNGPSELKPLLHTWSLAVEEQFYILFPLVMMIIFKLKEHMRKVVLSALFLLSLVATIIYVTINNSAAFFFTPFRAWEFLIGSFCTFAIGINLQRSVREVGAFVGLLLICGSIVIIDESMLFPGLCALPVCIGTACIIIFNNHVTLTSKLLAAKPVVFIGKISYSTYLVHWPLVVFYSYYIIREINLGEKILLVLLSFIGGYTIYSFVENRFRQTKISSKQTKLTFIYTVAFSAFIACIGLAIHVNEGFKHRFEINQAVATSNQADILPILGNCFLSTKESFDEWSGDNCFVEGTNKSQSNTLLWGDSHVNHLIYGISKNKAKIDSNVLVYASAGCPPIFNAKPNNRPNCSYNNSHIEEIIDSYNISHLVLASNWQYATTQGVELGQLSATISQLKALGVSVSLINQLPVYPINNPEYLTLRLSGDKPYKGNWLLKPSKGSRESKNLKNIAFLEQTPLIDSMGIFCEHGKCKIIVDGELMVKDAVHLSLVGSEYFISAILDNNRAFFN